MTYRLPRTVTTNYQGMRVHQVNYIAHEYIVLMKQPYKKGTVGQLDGVIPVPVHYYVDYRGYRFFVHQSGNGWGADYCASELETGLPLAYVVSEQTTGARLTPEYPHAWACIQKLRPLVDKHWGIFKQTIDAYRAANAKPDMELTLMIMTLL